MQLPCPHCGRRDLAEFRFGGDPVSPRPDPDIDADGWADWLFGHNQVAGWQAERWHHEFGCRTWFHLWRNTLTNAVGASAPVAEPLPPAPATEPTP